MRFIIAATTLLALSTNLSAQTTAPDSLWRIRALSSASPAVVSNPRDPRSWTGDIEGLERIAASTPSKSVSVLFVHGIGYTQREGNYDPFGFDLAKALVSAYGGALPSRTVSGRCQTPAGGIQVAHDGEVAAYSTDVPGTSVFTSDIACLDKITVPLKSPKLRQVTIYRLLWDNTMWDAFEYPHVGYDDKYPDDGVETVDALRQTKNRDLKAEVVTYGLSDAAMYIGPVGSLIREAIGAGICAVIADAGGNTSSPFNGDSPSALTQPMTRTQLCKSGSGGNSLAFAVMSHSLGSRAVFDVLTADVSDPLRKKLELIVNETIEVYMLANQIPLLGLGMVDSKKDYRKGAVFPTKKVKFVAVSEVNDLLTYELVPYFERLYFMRCRGATIKLPDCDPTTLNQKTRNEALGKDMAARRMRLETDSKARQALIDSLGFDAIDIRVRFASNFIPLLPLALLPFVDPMDAHSGHLSQPAIQDVIFCGVERGNPRSRGSRGCSP
jgi:hypothetical protein